MLRGHQGILDSGGNPGKAMREESNVPVDAGWGCGGGGAALLMKVVWGRGRVPDEREGMLQEWEMRVSEGKKHGEYSESVCTLVTGIWLAGNS